MTEFRVACSPTGTIYAGNIKENKDGYMTWTSNRRDVTDMAVDAVVQRLNGLPEKMEQYAWTLDGKDYVLKLVELKHEKKVEP